MRATPPRRCVWPNRRLERGSLTDIRLTAELPGLARARLADLTAALGVELLSHGARRAEPPAAVGPAPPGAKGDAIAWGELIVSIAGGLPAFVAFVRSWTGDHRGSRIRLEIDGDVLVVEGGSDAERERLAQAWLERHAAPKAG